MRQTKDKDHGRKSMPGKKKPAKNQTDAPAPDGKPDISEAETELKHTHAAGSGADRKDRPDEGFPVVGIGASAGGLAAFESFLSAMPANTLSGMAFVLVQHLSPDHKSILSNLVRNYTSMQVYEVKDGMEVKPDCAYIIPPNRDMALLNGRLHLLEFSEPRGLRLPIDFFFRSLAQDQRERAICIVLSGTGSDGTQGVRAVKGEGGMVMVQDPDSTEYDGMPRSAIATGIVDYVLKPADMPSRLIAYSAHAFGKRLHPVSVHTLEPSDILKKICILLRTHTGHDFSQYKENTLNRRVERRMAINQIERPDEYLRYLQQSSAEAEALFRDLLIGVTNFFRDPAAFEALRKKVIPGMFAAGPSEEPVRIWVCGCSTGEEAYSIAILIREYLETRKQTFKVQIFATDIDKQAIEKARNGIFSASIAADVSPERLEHFFTRDSKGYSYHIRKVIRDLLVFSEQDVTKDPPFSKLSLISCRNLLIYMNGDLQKKLIPLFHYSLKPGGILFLGTSETTGEFVTEFEAIDRKWKIYRRKEDTPERVRPAFKTLFPAFPEAAAHPGHFLKERHTKTGIDFHELTEHALLKYYAQTAILINSLGDVLYIYGRTGKYLEPAPGHTGTNILPMAREGLRRELTTAIHKAVNYKKPVNSNNLKVRTNGEFVNVNMCVMPVRAESGETVTTELYLVILEEISHKDSDLHKKTGITDDSVTAAETDSRVVKLEQELNAKEEYLQSTIEEMETSNEELKSTNEEMQSVNEELQSTNEELETSKEELQSVNEELATVNAELQTKVADLSQANNDMNNLLAGTGVGTLFVDRDMKISRFTPSATGVINLIKSDIGRPIGHIALNLAGYDSLLKDIKSVLDTLIPFETEIRTKEGEWYLMSIRPYRTLENVIEGAVVTFVDITKRKKMEEALKDPALLEAKIKFCDSIVATIRESLLVLDDNLRVVLANRSFYNVFKVKKEETLNKKLHELGNGQWDIPELGRLLKEILPKDSSFDDFEVTHEFSNIGKRTMLLNARRIFSSDEKTRLIVLSIEDITGRKYKAGKAPGRNKNQ